MKKRGIIYRLFHGALAATGSAFQEGKFSADRAEAANPTPPSAAVVTTQAMDQREMDAAHEMSSHHTEKLVAAREAVFQAEMSVIEAEKKLFELENAGFAGLKYENQMRAWKFRAGEMKERNPKLFERWCQQNPKPARPKHLLEKEASELEAKVFGGGGASQQPAGVTAEKAPEGNTAGKSPSVIKRCPGCDGLGYIVKPGAAFDPPSQEPCPVCGP